MHSVLSYTALSRTVSLWPSFINQGLRNRWFYIFRICKKQDLEMPDAINNASLLMQRHYPRFLVEREGWQRQEEGYNATCSASACWVLMRILGTL